MNKCPRNSLSRFKRTLQLSVLLVLAVAGPTIANPSDEFEDITLGDDLKESDAFLATTRFPQSSTFDRESAVQTKFTIPGQSISNWDLMERLKKGVAPIQFSAIRVTESSLEKVILEADLPTKKIMKQAIKVLESMTVKVSGFSDPVRVRAAEAKSDFPSRHDWDLFFMKNGLDESKAGERPDTIYLAKIPIKWFAEKGSDLPSEDLLRIAMEAFGSVRMVDIPACDEIRKEMSPQISGIKNKGFGFGPDVFFEAYVQFSEYSGFVNAMDSLRNMKWTKRIDKKVFHANVKVDFDRTRHLSDASIKRRQAERIRIYAEKRQIVEEEKRRIAEKEAEARRLLEEKEKKREERERKRKERYEAERLRKEAERLKRDEEERLAKEIAERKQRQLESRVVESRRLLEAVFTHIQRKEDRRKEVQEARLRAEQRAAELEDISTSDKERHLRAMLLRQREIVMREKLKEKIRRAKDDKSAVKNSGQGSVDASSDDRTSGESLKPSKSSLDRHRNKRWSSSSKESDFVRKREQRKKYNSKNDDIEDSEEDKKQRKRYSKSSTSSEDSIGERDSISRSSSDDPSGSGSRRLKKRRSDHRKKKKRRIDR